MTWRRPESGKRPVTISHAQGSGPGAGGESGTAGSGHEVAGAAVAAGASVVARRPPTTAESLFDLSRGRQATLSIAQPGLAAVLAAGGMPGAHVVAIGLVAAWAGFFAVFSLNDVLDRRVDAAALRAGKAEFDGYDLDAAFLRHPLAQGALSLRLSILWVAGLALIAAAGAWLLSPLCLILFAAAAALEALYCGLRSVTWAKTVISGIMVGCGGLAGWAAVAPLHWSALPVFLFLALWEIGCRNLANDLADLGPDRAVGIRTVATTFGPAVAARANLLVAAAVLVTVPFLGLDGLALVMALASGVVLVAWPAVRLYREPTSARAGWYFNVASLYPVALLLAAVGAWAAGRW
jgi:4-hydroxybenzoate polyprenyltransferase